MIILVLYTTGIIAKMFSLLLPKHHIMRTRQAAFFLFMLFTLGRYQATAGSTKKNASIKDSLNQVKLVVPTGYKLYEQIKGDLNNDGLDDYVLIVKRTDKEGVVINRFDKEVDRNRRGILIFLSGNNELKLATENLNCFSSENEDGGVYFPPELRIEIRKGKLYIKYDHGRYGYWKYTLSYKDADFALIGYDASENFGPIVKRETSINFLTKKKLTRENINQDEDESVEPTFEDTWEDIEVKELHLFSEIEDFDELEIYQY